MVHNFRPRQFPPYLLDFMNGYPALQPCIIRGIKGVVKYTKNKLASRLKQHEHRVQLDTDK